MKKELVAIQGVLGHKGYHFNQKTGVLTMVSQPLTGRQIDHLKAAGMRVARQDRDADLAYDCSLPSQGNSAKRKAHFHKQLVAHHR